MTIYCYVLALIIAPTRELCLQIVEVLEKVARPFSWLVPGHITGTLRHHLSPIII